MRQSSQHRYNLRSRNTPAPTAINYRTSFGERSIQKTGNDLWHSIPADIKECLNKNVFKTSYKKFLLLNNVVWNLSFCLFVYLFVCFSSVTSYPNLDFALTLDLNFCLNYEFFTGHDLYLIWKSLGYGVFFLLLLFYIVYIVFIVMFCYCLIFLFYTFIILIFRDRLFSWLVVPFRSICFYAYKFNLFVLFLFTFVNDSF